MTGGPREKEESRRSGLYRPATPGEPCTVIIDGSKLLPPYDVERLTNPQAKGTFGMTGGPPRPTIQKIEGSTLGVPLILREVADNLKFHNYPVFLNDGDHPYLVIASDHSDSLEIYPDGAIYLNYTFIDPYIWNIFSILMHGSTGDTLLPEANGTERKEPTE